ncbi:LysE family translocator [Metabacillus sp. GX 13764]|uniref:LysE family translocator n=1 Tax=Metabacillus kandeliae TaxID=2900151 RepID=UPI001E64EF92|nr:LysE family transporter [Metabacillus kandeliae]MCD7034086.1 LysE family translocator [Metabacillus kandeliae]
MLFLKGILIGLSIAAPVGPIGVLCMQRTLREGRAAGFLTGAGAASADAVYGTLAGFGVSLLAGFFIQYHAWFQAVGAVFLLYMGSRVFFSQTAEIGNAAIKKGKGAKGYVTGFFLTMTNPMTILSFGGIFAAFGLSGGHSYTAVLLLAGGIFAGSLLWWFLLSFIISLVKHKLGHKGLSVINRLSGALILAFGFYFLACIV